jgi:hypothetical protein
MKTQFFRKTFKLALVAILLAGLYLIAVPAQPAQAASYDVLFIIINGMYNADGNNIFTTLQNVAGAANVQSVTLSSDGQAAALLAANTYEQIWTYDLSKGADNYPTDYAAIDTWFDAHPGCAVVMDGRILSSYWNGRWSAEGQNLTYNYYTNFSSAGCGLLISTDDSDYVGGTNQLNATLGFNSFFGSFGGAFPTDTTNPLMNTPNLIASLFNDSTTGQAPFGFQPNGLYLYTVGYHSGNPDTPGISSTIGGSLGINVAITNPADGSSFSSGTISFTADVTGGTTPYSCAWYSSVDGSLGTGTSISVDASSLSSGGHVITIECTDSATPSPHYDEDSIGIEIQTCIDSAQSGPWASGSTWVGGVVPTISDGACINDGHTVTLDAAAAAEALWVFSGGTLDLVTYGFTVENGVKRQLEMDIDDN